MTEGAREQGRRSGGRSRTAAWLVWTFYGLMTCLVIMASGAGLLSQDGSNNMLRLTSDALITIATPVVFATVAAMIVSLQPRNTIGWLLTVVVGAFLVGEPLENYVDHLASSSPTPRWRWVSVAAIAWATLFVLMTTLSRRLTTPDLAFDNPIGVLGEGTVELLAGVWIAGLLLLLAACTLALCLSATGVRATPSANRSSGCCTPVPCSWWCTWAVR